MDKFFEAISAFSNLKNDSKQALSLILKRVEFPKGHILIKENTICNYVYFVEKGLTRTYYYKSGKDVTDWISAENSFACSIISFITRKPDRRIIELLEPSVIWSLYHRDLENLYPKYHDIENLGRRMAELGLTQVQQRFDDLHFSTALQRYKTLLKDTPSYINRVPLGILASYLGMTQETLSRMRAKI